MLRYLLLIGLAFPNFCYSYSWWYYTTPPPWRPKQDPCMSGWFNHGKHCYKLSNKTSGWFEAELECQKHNGHLASILDAEEESVFRSVSLCKEETWLGMILTDVKNWHDTSAWQWWDKEGNSFSKLQLKPNAESENCVFHSQNEKWLTDNCRKEKKFVCKAPMRKNSKQLLCPRGWTYYDYKCFWVSSNETNYFHAQLACQDRDATVASIHTYKEQALLQTLQGCDGEVWIGLEKSKPCVSRRTSDCWEWMDRSQFHHMDWQGEYPKTDAVEAECVVNDGGWKIADCTKKARFVCKKPSKSY